jgi:hypothetical protein
VVSSFVSPLCGCRLITRDIQDVGTPHYTIYNVYVHTLLEWFRLHALTVVFFVVLGWQYGALEPSAWRKVARYVIQVRHTHI